jgi:hypothetical protein
VGEGDRTTTSGLALQGEDTGEEVHCPCLDAAVGLSNLDLTSRYMGLGGTLCLPSFPGEPTADSSGGWALKGEVRVPSHPFSRGSTSTTFFSNAAALLEALNAVSLSLTCTGRVGVEERDEFLGGGWYAECLEAAVDASK